MMNCLSKTSSRTSFFAIWGCFLALVLQGTLDAKPLKCDVPAPVAILIDADTGVVLYEKNAHTPCFVASTTKVATALYALEKKGSFLDAEIKASQEAIGIVPSSVRRNSGKHPSYRLEYGGTHMGIRTGEILPLRALFYGLMLCSGNDAANVIAEYVSGNIPQFIKEMNAFLKTKGCLETSFNNPHGLADPDHKTSAYDLALMTSWALKHPFFREVVQTVRYTRPQTNKQPESYILQSNALLRPGHRHYYPHAIGIKTGYTIAAGHNLVAAAEKNGRRVIAVVLNCEDLNKKYKAAVTLFEAAFNETKVQRKLFAKNYDFFTRSFKGAHAPLEAALQNDVFIEYYPSEESDFKAMLHWDNVKLPINKDQRVGEIQVRDGRGQLCLTAPLYAKKDITPTLAYKTSELCGAAVSFAERQKHFAGVILGATFLVLAFFIRRTKPKKKA